MVRRLAALLVACSLGGCSLLLDNGQFVGAGDSGVERPRDAAPDAQPPDAGPDAPSSPTVVISPDPARTLDELTASIDTESVDPLDRGPVTYEYRWLVDDSDASLSTPTVPSERTTKGETWRVEVTPVTADDRRGIPGTAEAVIQNTPPTIQTVGLETYRPVSGDVLRALPGRTEDADGDTVNIRYRWLVDGSPSPMTGSRLPLVDTIGAGSAIRVEARAFDGTDESPPETTGEAVVVENVRRWIQHWPDRGNVRFVTFDPRHERVLLGVESSDAGRQELWEHDLAADRFVRLRATGPQVTPDFPQPAVYDERSQRLLFVLAASGEASIVELDVARRGEEVWREVPLEGTVPGELAFGAAFDSTRNRLIVSAPDGTGTATELYEIDMSGDVGDVRLLAAGQPAALGFGAWVPIPGTEEVMVLGGGESFMTMTPSNLVHRLRLDDLESGAEELTVRLPRAAALVAAAAAEDGSRLLFGLGLSGSGAETGFWTMDLTSLEVTPAPLTSPRGDDKLFGYLMTDTRSGRWLLYPGKDGLFSPAEYELFGIPFSADAMDDVHAYGTQVPAPLYAASGAVVLENPRFYGGVDRGDAAREEVWEMTVAGGQAFDGFSRLPVAPDPMTGSPDPRAFVGFVGSFEARPRFAFFGGSDGSGGLVDNMTWRLDDTRWIARSLTGGAIAPSTRSGATFFETCGRDLAVFGGRTATGLTNEVLVMRCASIDDGCDWTTLAPAGTAPSPRSSAGLYTAGSDAVVLGGLGAGGTSVDAFVLESCGTSWASLTVAGDVPSARSGHSVTAGATIYLFGGDASAGYQQDLYEVARTGSTLTFTRITPEADGDAIPEGRAHHVALRSGSTTAGFDRVFIVGGSRGRVGFGGGARVLGDVWELRIPD